MKKIIFSLLTILSLHAFAQESIPAKDANAKDRELNGSFTAISVTDGIDVYLTQGQTESVAVMAADEKYLSRFKTELVSGTLKIYYDNNGINFGFNEKRKLKAWVTCRNLNKITLSGGADIKSGGALDVDRLEMRVTSGAHFAGKVNAKDLDVDQSSGSGVTISGRADKIKVEGNSASIFKGYDLVVDYCEAKASSGAGVHVTINKELNAKANSGGGIRFKGEALIKDLSVSSGGIVKKEKSK
jgi:hypothetical protein